jgi:hypothetical protein
VAQEAEVVTLDSLNTKIKNTTVIREIKKKTKNMNMFINLIILLEGEFQEGEQGVDVEDLI